MLYGIAEQVIWIVYITSNGLSRKICVEVLPLSTSYGLLNLLSHIFITSCKLHFSLQFYILGIVGKIRERFATIRFGILHGSMFSLGIWRQKCNMQTCNLACFVWTRSLSLRLNEGHGQMVFENMGLRVLNVAMNLRVPKNAENFLPNWGTISFATRTLLRGVICLLSVLHALFRPR